MTLYALGSNGNGQLGLAHKDDVALPQECIFAASPSGRPLRVVAGGNFSVVLFESGQIFLAGRIFSEESEHGLSSKNALDRFTPLHLPNSQKVKLCAASWEALHVVTGADEIFACGRGSQGELGLGHETTLSRDLVPLGCFLPDGVKVVDIVSGIYHTLVLLDNGELFGWGNGRKGQVGLPHAIVWKPRRLEGIGFCVSGIACGKDFSVLVGRGAKSKLAVIGSDKWLVRSDAPTAIPNWNQLDATWGGVTVLLEDGRSKSWGRSDRGQLGPAEDTDVVSIAAGSEHLVLIKKSGIICHGWGEHGNCGPVVDAEGNARAVPAPLKLPDAVSKTDIEGVGAGCATTFFWTSTGG